MIRKPLLAACAALGSIFFASCGGGGGGGSSPPPAPATYSIRANIGGLFGTGLELSLNGGQAIGVSANGTSSLGSGFQNGQAYTVTVSKQPVDPAQECTLTNATSTINGGNVEVGVSCNVVAATSVLTSVSLDAAEPAWARDRVVSVISAEDESVPGGQIAVPWAPGNSIGPIMALDDDGQIVFAAMGGARNVSLTSGTTAVFLTRVLLGSADDGQPSPNVDSAIRAAAGFANLEAAVRAAFNAGRLPLSSRDVVSGINTVIAQLPESIRDPRARKGAARISQVISSPRIGASPSPFPVVESGIASWIAVRVTGASASGGVSISNGMPIAWKAGTKGPDGQLLCSLGDPSCGMLDRSSLLGSAVSSALGLDDLFADDVSGNGTALDLTIGQTSATRKANVHYIMSELIGVLFEGLMPGGNNCEQAIVSGFLSTEEIVQAFSDPTPESVLQKLANIQVDRLESLIATYATECAWKDPAAFSKAARGFIKKALLVYDVLDKVYTAVDIALVMELTYRYWDAAPVTYGVCLGKTFGFYSIANCAASYAFEPADIYIGPGAITKVPEPLARDADGKPTIAGAPLYTPSSARPELFQFDPVDKTVTALDPNALETFEVRVDDPATGATGASRIHTVWPQIDPGYGNLAAGAELTFKLTDAEGHAISDVAQGIQWTIRQGDQVTTVLPVNMSLDGVSATVRIPDPVPTGEFTLSAHCAECTLGIYSYVPLHLGVPYVKLEWTTPPKWTGTPNYGLWASAWFAGGSPRCINFSGEYTRRIWNQKGDLQREDTVSGTGDACMQTGGLGDWIKREDGKYWGLMHSGGVGSGGRMEITGTFYFDIPGVTNPYREQHFTCNVTGTNWACGP